MDLQGTAQLLGNFGEFVGAIAVVITLAFLTIQVRQNTNAVRSSTQESYRSSVSSLNDFAAAYAHVFSKIDLGTHAKDMTPEEYTITRALFFKLIGVNESAFIHYQEGTISKEVFEARMRGFAPVIKQQNFCELWEEYKEFGWTRSFIDYVDNVLLIEAT